MTPSSSRPGVLVVDDDAMLGRLLAQGLSHHGFPVWWAPSGVEAVRLYSEHLLRVDVILLDVRMPGWDGPRVLQSLRALNAQVECWFMSGMVDQETENRLLAIGGRRFFPKPFHLHELVHALEHWAGGSDTDLLPGLAQSADAANTCNPSI